MSINHSNVPTLINKHKGRELYKQGGFQRLIGIKIITYIYLFK